MIHRKWRLGNILKNSVSIFILYLFAFLIIGCASGPDSYRMVNKGNTNIVNLEKSRIGMTKTEVLTLMGTAQIREI
jgi:outer membrane protein assembly factor BamE (lipoprotein component of BamABCDE complex)